MDDPNHVTEFIKLTNQVVYLEHQVDATRKEWSRCVDFLEGAEKQLADEAKKLRLTMEDLDYAKDDLAKFLRDRGQEEETD